MKAVFILLCVVTMAVTQETDERTTDANAVNEKKVEARTRLFKALFENYNPEVNPAGTNVKFGMSLITAKLVETTLDTNVWMRMVWNDGRLKWEEKDFGGIGVLRVSPSNVWIPDLRLYNAADTRHGDYSSACDSTNVLIYPNGEVLWVPPCRFFSICEHSLEHHHQHVCPMKFGSWTYDGFEMDLTFYNNDPNMDLSDMSDITPWKVLSASGQRTSKKYACCEEPYIDITFNVTMQRKPAVVTLE